jgi:hypothetical protein
MDYKKGLTANFPLNKAYANLQTAILRLSEREAPKGPERSRELKPLVDQALQAYREYMKVAGSVAI